MTRSPWATSTVVLYLVLCTLGLLAACGQRPPHDDDRPAHDAPAAATRAAGSADDLLHIDAEMLRDLRITTSAVESRPGGEGVTALGELGVDEERYAEVGTALAARVRDVVVGPGDSVTAGQTLAVLESVELGRIRAEVLAARAHAALAQQTLARRRALAADRIAPRREVEEAEAAAAAADADLRASEAALRTLSPGPDDDAATGAAFALRAPLAGIVIERAAVRGQATDPARPLFRIADLNRLWLTVHAFERDAVRVARGAQARVTLAALPGRSLHGMVALIASRVDPASRTVDVRVELSNDDGVLRPGMAGTAWLPLGDDDRMVVAVPTAALQRLHDGWRVFLPRADGVFEARPVGRGRDLGGEVEVVTGLAPGETVVVDGAFLLKAEAEKARSEGEHHEH